MTSGAGKRLRRRATIEDGDTTSIEGVDVSESKFASVVLKVAVMRVREGEPLKGRIGGELEFEGNSTLKSLGPGLSNYAGY